MQVCECLGVLYELNTRLLIFNKTLILTMKALSHAWYMLSVLTDVYTAVTLLTFGILVLPSDPRNNLLLDVKDEIH